MAGLWGMRVVPSCLAPGPGVIRVEEYCLLECKSQIVEMVLSLGSGLVNLHVKSILPGK